LSQIVLDLTENESDIFAFSCYLWNIELMKSLLSRLQKAHPDSHFNLGGPQVMHHAHEYLSPEDNNTIICNGEGEITFANYLRECLNPTPDYSNINGISFYKSGELITTPLKRD
jgi:putative methyltransferase